MNATIIFITFPLADAMLVADAPEARDNIVSFSHRIYYEKLSRTNDPLGINPNT